VGTPSDPLSHSWERAGVRAFLPSPTSRERVRVRV